MTKDDLVVKVKALTNGMSLAQKISCLVMSYGDINVPPATGSIIVNQLHLTDSGVPLLRKQISIATQRRGFPVLVGADQEGGKVNRLTNYSPTARTYFPSAREMQEMNDEEIQSEGIKTGDALRLAGVNLLMAPVLDVADKGTFMYNQHRSFGAHTADVINRGQAFVDGLRRSGNSQLVIIAKHFPGYNVPGNSDVVPVEDDAPADQIKLRSEPFFTVMGCDGVMLSSIRYAKLDSQPACFSKRIVDQYRSRFLNGFVMTDDLSARGLSKSALASELTENAKRAFLASVDVILVMDSRRTKHVEAGITAALNESSANPDERARLERQLDASVGRVLSLAIRADVTRLTS